MQILGTVIVYGSYNRQAVMRKGIVIKDAVGTSINYRDDPNPYLCSEVCSADEVWKTRSFTKRNGLPELTGKYTNNLLAWADESVVIEDSFIPVSYLHRLHEQDKERKQNEF